MSTFQVEVLSIDAVNPHPNADRLELLVVQGWNCVSGKGRFKPGDKVVYFPIDSVLPVELEAKLFPPDSKIKLNKSRVKTIKIRGAISQGLCVEPAEVGLEAQNVGSDVTKLLGVTRFEPPKTVRPGQNNMPKKKKFSNPDFQKYTSIENEKKYNRLFSTEDDVVVTEKIHGTNFRAGYAPTHANTWLKKLKKMFGLLPKQEFVYGSHNVQLQDKMLYDGFYDKNVYAEAVVKYNLKTCTPVNTVIYGEVYGDGIQKGYNYGCSKGERKLVVFDVMVDGKYLDHESMLAFCQAAGLPTVPVLYSGKYYEGIREDFVDGNSVLAPDQKVREGVVLKTLTEQVSMVGRKMVKLISDNYLLRNQDIEEEEGVEYDH